MPAVTVDASDLLKLYDAIRKADEFFAHRDRMNAAVHLGEARYSPLTTLVRTEAERLQRILSDAGVA
jgi:hypothetical protein